MKSNVNEGVYELDTDVLFKYRNIETDALIHHALFVHISMDSRELIQAVCERLNDYERKIQRLEEELCHYVGTKEKQ